METGMSRDVQVLLLHDAATPQLTLIRNIVQTAKFISNFHSSQNVVKKANFFPNYTNSKNIVNKRNSNKSTLIVNYCSVS